MSISPIKFSLMKSALLSFGVLVAGAAISANELQQITVTATRIEAVKTEIVGHSPGIGAPIERISIARSVRFSDLDLSTHSGAMRLERRISETATAACKELDRLYPLTPAGGPSCVNEAIKGATVQAHEAVAAAEKARAAATQ